MREAYESATGSVHVGAIQGSRSEQQDAVRIRWLEAERAWLIVLADGMGGHAAGEVASKLAVDSFVAAFAARREVKAAYDDAFTGALQEANTLIGSVQTTQPQTAGMGTTLVAAHIAGDQLRWISVGDSPLWLLRGASATRLNADHSLRGIAPAARGQASANALTSALIGKKIDRIDVHAAPFQIRAGDRIIVASDGLLTLSEQEIAAILTAHPGATDAATAALIEAVEQVDNPRQDNCTVAVFAPSAAATRRTSPTARLIYAALLVAVVAAIAAAVRWFYLP